MFNRLSLTLIVTLAAPLAALPGSSASQTATQPPVSNGSELIATKIAEFYEQRDVSTLAFRPNDQELAAGSLSSDEVHVWTWQGRSSIARTLRFSRANGINGLRYSPNGKLLAGVHFLGDPEKLLRILDSDTGETIHNIPDASAEVNYGIAFSPDGQLFMMSQNIGLTPGDNFVVYSTHSWERAWALRTAILFPETFALSRDGELAALGGSVRVAPDAAKPYMQPRLAIIGLEKHTSDRSIDVLSANCEVQFVAWSSDGVRIAVGGRPVFAGSRLTTAAVEIFDRTTGRQVGEFTYPQAQHVQGLVFTPDGKHLVIDWDGVVEIWDSTHEHLSQRIEQSTKATQAARAKLPPGAITVSPDGRYLAIADGQHVSIWQFK
jgi:WD40 repeat protein